MLAGAAVLINAAVVAASSSAGVSNFSWSSTHAVGHAAKGPWGKLPVLPPRQLWLKELEIDGHAQS